YELFTYKPKVDLSWEEIKTSWEGFFGTSNEIDFGVTKKSIKDALRDIPKLCTNKTYPINELSEWERKFNYWLTLFDSSVEAGSSKINNENSEDTLESDSNNESNNESNESV
ncbi:9073_t:CDS:2, partial [Funneliformis geosporum]